jgi:hypothetical protein
LNIPKAERESGVRIVGICENDAGDLTVHVESTELDSVCVKINPIWASRA